MSLDDITAAIAAEFPDAWWEVNSNGTAKLVCEFSYWSEELQEEWWDRAVFDGLSTDAAGALHAALCLARIARTESEASLAKRPSKATREEGTHD